MNLCALLHVIPSPVYELRIRTSKCPKQRGRFCELFSRSGSLRCGALLDIPFHIPLNTLDFYAFNDITHRSFFPQKSHHFLDFVFKRSGDRYSKATTSETTSLVHLIDITHYLFTSASLIITLSVHFFWKNEKNETINSNSLGGSITYGSNCLPATCCHSLQWCGTSSRRS